VFGGGFQQVPFGGQIGQGYSPWMNQPSPFINLGQRPF
jgi:hypothetical protein